MGKRVGIGKQVDPGQLVEVAEKVERVEKGLRAESVQARYSGAAESGGGFLPVLSMWARAWEQLPPYGSPARTQALRELWQSEPILSGAVYSMSAKLASMGWTLTGEEQQVAMAHDVLMNAAGGMGWTFLMEQVCQDAFGADVGGTVELVYAGKRAEPPVVGLYALDAARVRLQNDLLYPVVYLNVERARQYRLLADEVIRVVSLPSPREEDVGLGFCAVSRAAQLAFLLRELWLYDKEMLSDLPPSGMIGVSRIHPKVFEQQLMAYKEAKESREHRLFPGIFWLASTDDLNFDLLSFRVMPEGLERQQMVEIYAKVLALAFGVDVAEFWQIEHSGATKAATTVQAKKAQGKGPAEILSYIERGINAKALRGLDVVFEFDEPDDEADMLRAERMGKVAQSVAALYTAIGPDGQSLLSKSDAIRLLVEEGVLGAWALEEFGEARATDTGEVETGEQKMRRLAERVLDRDVRVRALYDQGAAVVCKRWDGAVRWRVRKPDAPRYYVVRKVFVGEELRTVLQSRLEERAAIGEPLAVVKKADEADAVELDGDGSDGRIAGEELERLYEQWLAWSRESA